MKQIKTNSRRPRIHAHVARQQNGALQAALARGADPNAVCVNRIRPLHIAAALGDEYAAEMLLAAGANPSARRRPDGADALHLAACSGATEIVQMLVERGLDPARPDLRGRTPLHYAAAGSGPTLTAALYLLDRGVPIDPQDADEYTPLLVAIDHANLPVAYALKLRGATVTLRAQESWQASNLATECWLNASYIKGRHREESIYRDLARLFRLD